MRYALMLILIVSAINTVLTGPMITSTAIAQDTTEERLTALETLVEVQQARIDVLEARLDALERSSPDMGASSADRAGNIATVSGIGGIVSADFRLDGGRYTVTASVEVTDFDGFALYIYSPNGDDDLLFNEVINETGVWTGSVIFDAPERGNYFVEAQNTGSPWTLAFEPR